MAAMLDNYSRTDDEVWDKIQDILQHEVTRCSYDGAMLSSSDGTVLSSYCYNNMKGKHGLILSNVSSQVSKFTCGPLKSLTSFSSKINTSFVFHHGYIDPLVVTLMATAVISPTENKSKNNDSSCRLGVNVSDMRGSVVFLRNQIGTLVNKMVSINYHSRLMNNFAITSFNTWEESIINRVQCGQAIPFDQQREAWVMLAKQRRRKSLLLCQQQFSSSASHDTNVEGSSTISRYGGGGGPECVGIDPIVKDHIARDVPRTYTNEPLFKVAKLGGRKNRPNRVSKNTSNDAENNNNDNDEYESSDGRTILSVGGKLLFDLLCEFATQHPDIGYSQGMNFIGAVILIVTKAEINGIQDAMTIFTAAIYEVKSFFVDDLPGFAKGLDMLNQLMQHHLPSLHDHLNKHDIHLQMFASPWLHCLFTHPSVPLKFAMHTFELFLLMGFEGIIRVSLALLALHEKALLSLDSSSEIIKLLQLATKDVLLSKLNNVMHLALTFRLEKSVVAGLRTIGFLKTI
jgi:hypothetical protein